MLQLSAHPAGAATRAAVAVAAARRGDGALLIDYRLDYPAARAGAVGETGSLAPLLQIPAAGMPLPADRLWAFTCFELFVGRVGQPGYREFNFSPSGQWAGWTFRDYRQRDEDAGAPPLPAPQLAWWRAGDAATAALPPRIAEPVALPDNASPLALGGKCLPLLVLRAVLPAAALPTGAGALQLGLSAVVVRGDGDAAYFALQHPLERPDFHDRAGFVLSLPG
ncbi:hypothetical protein [Rhodocyclus tenuis]|uniref:hypothetical protein n=1 Tax=Rhodocyclus tenuis TaxID=1066 RepID=UPI0019088EC2|nr:hypothetical protein [Rhodocyclus tenuis]